MRQCNFILPPFLIRKLLFDAGLVENIFYMKNEYDAGAVLISSVNSILKPVKKWKAAKYPAIFQWLDANFPEAR